MSYTLYVFAPTESVGLLSISYSTGQSYNVYPQGESTACHSNTAVANSTTVTITPTFASGYQISRWVINEGGTVRYSYSSTLSYTNTGSASTVYLRVEAQQTSTTYYATLVFDDNGGSGGPGSVTGSITGTSSTVTIQIPYTTPTKAGYSFLYWQLSYSTGTSIYYPGGSASVVGSPYGTSYTLVAVWEAKPVYKATLVFNTNGGSGGPGSVTGTSETTAVPITIPYPAPTRTGYSFGGWLLTYAGGSTHTYQIGETANVEGSQSGITYTLYAVWNTAGGGAYLYSGGYKTAKVYIYTTSWNLYTPYMFNGTTWKRCV